MCVYHFIQDSFTKLKPTLDFFFLGTKYHLYAIKDYSLKSNKITMLGQILIHEL